MDPSLAKFLAFLLGMFLGWLAVVSVIGICKLIQRKVIYRNHISSITITNHNGVSQIINIKTNKD